MDTTFSHLADALAADGSFAAEHPHCPTPSPDSLPVACGHCGGVVLTASGRHRCLKCGRDYGAVDRAAQDDAGDLLGATERGDRFETL